MRLFPSTARRERCTSAPFSKDRKAVGAQACGPPSPLAAKLTRPKTSSRSSIKSLSKRKKNAVHPIDLRDLESELELLPEPARTSPVQDGSVAPTVPPCGFTITVSVLHALDLPNPCQIRSCRHPLQPCALVSINDSESTSFSATRHAKNYSSWGQSAQFSYHVDAAAAAQLHVVRVRVGASCTRQSMELATPMIGELDELLLSADSPREFSQFFTMFRYHTAQNRVIKYFAGKLKLAITIQSDPEIAIPTEQSKISGRGTAHGEPIPSVEPPQTPPTLPPSRPSFLPANFGDVLQLKRRQLKTIVVPINDNCVNVKAVDDPEEVRGLLQSLSMQARDHLVTMEDVNPRESVGEGVHASVRRAEIRKANGEVVEVAMKEFRYVNATSGAPPPLKVLQAFQHEYAMLRLITTASQFQDHANTTTIRLIGIMITPRLAIYTDFCRGGSLAKCLETSTTWDQVSMQKKFELARQLASGLARCHDLDVVHRDIKTHNIMVDDLHSQHPIVKIGDFGSAVVKRPPDPPLHEEIGSAGYTAPEIFQSCGYDQRADIWSLGIVLWELLCTSSTSKLQNPFLGICSDDIVRKAHAGERPVIPPQTLPKWCESLLLRCWAEDPAQRISASEIASQFQTASTYDTS